MKRLRHVIMTLALMTPLWISSQQVDASPPIKVEINGQSLQFDQPPIMEKNRVLVPMRTIFETVGAEVEWVAQTSTVKAKKGNVSIVLPLNHQQATVNGTTKNLDVPAKIVNGRTLVPIRFVSEALGCKVEWKAEKSLVAITFDGQVKLPIGKVYADGWVAPVLKSAWSPNSATNFATLQNELGFKEDGHFYGIEGASHAIVVNSDSGSNEVTFKFYMWDGNAGGAMPQAYRIPIVAKELFKLYFGGDANRVWNYFNNNDIPDQFTANGRLCKASFIEADGSVYFQVGYSSKLF